MSLHLTSSHSLKLTEKIKSSSSKEDEAFPEAVVSIRISVAISITDYH